MLRRFDGSSDKQCSYHWQLIATCRMFCLSKVEYAWP